MADLPSMVHGVGPRAVPTGKKNPRKFTRRSSNWTYGQTSAFRRPTEEVAAVQKYHETTFFGGRQADGGGSGVFPRQPLGAAATASGVNGSSPPAGRRWKLADILERFRRPLADVGVFEGAQPLQ